MRAHPSLSTVEPQTSTNYQAGIVYHGPQLSLDVDAYTIDFNNKFVSTGSGLTAGFTNIGGAQYRGIEAQATFAFGNGFAIFANGSLNMRRRTIPGFRSTRPRRARRRQA